jgi:hypothetical protein
MNPGDSVVVEKITEYTGQVGIIIRKVMCRYYDKYDSHAECEMIEIQFQNKTVLLPKDMIRKAESRDNPGAECMLDRSKRDALEAWRMKHRNRGAI